MLQDNKHNRQPAVSRDLQPGRCKCPIAASEAAATSIHPTHKRRPLFLCLCLIDTQSSSFYCKLPASFNWARVVHNHCDSIDDYDDSLMRICLRETRPARLFRRLSFIFKLKARRAADSHRELDSAGQDELSLWLDDCARLSGSEKQNLQDAN